ncbi:MAG: ATP-dependent DNA helicase RecG [Solirubrobacteraceae bacterium]
MATAGGIIINCVSSAGVTAQEGRRAAASPDSAPLRYRSPEPMTAGEPTAASVRVPLRFGSREPMTAGELTAASFRAPRPSLLASRLQTQSERVRRALGTLGIETVGDLLWHLPRQLRAARAAGTLAIDEQATIAVEVRSISRRSARRRVRGRPLVLVEAIVEDATGTLTATFFNQPWLLERYRPGTRLILHGTLRSRRRFAVSHHAPGDGDGVDRGSEQRADGGADARELRAVAHYPATEGVSSTQILALVERHRTALAHVHDPLPARLLAAQRLPQRAAALAAVHFPADPDRAELGRRRLAFEELLLQQLALRRRRAVHASQLAVALHPPGSLTARWLAHGLPFELTSDQRSAIRQIDEDLASLAPMQRLLMGEVGSGKTVVALYAMLRAVENGLQAALMAPTETLAQQHFATLQTLAPDGLLSAALLTGSTPARRRADVLRRAASGELSLLVGTHALIEADVELARLGVVIVDEQHRFGVRQRATLADSAPVPHALHMSATPIPRTLALTRFGDLDVTRLRELPAHRQPIATHIAASARERARAYERLREELTAGRQAYVVCPLVSESSEIEARAAVAEYELLRTGELADFDVALLHGQMRPPQKLAAIEAFASGAADVLVATTVIEVGIDVPNATVVLIENAERYGIAQLHQLRGRVGRGRHASLCLLFGSGSSPRLRALVQHSDGFELAEIDLALREGGQLADDGERGGPRQSGAAAFRVARLPDDEDLLRVAARAAKDVLAADPGLQLPEHALLVQALAPIPA